MQTRHLLLDYSLITGFKSSFDIRFDVESTLDYSGRFVVDTVKNIILDSPLYHLDIPDNEPLPSMKNPLPLIYNYYTDYQPISPNLKLLFFLSEDDNIPTFQLFNNDILISSYAIGIGLQNVSDETLNFPRLLNYPLKIKTLDGILTIDIYGRFSINKRLRQI